MEKKTINVYYRIVPYKNYYDNRILFFYGADVSDISGACFT